MVVTSTPNDLKTVSDYMAQLKSTIDDLALDQLENAIKLFRNAYHADQTIFTMGNGGSGSTASHMAVDINKGACFTSDKKFKVLCLNDNIPTLLALANDVDYESVFVQQLKNFFRPGDLVLGISGSGNSPNVLRAIEHANDNGGVTLGVTGFNGGKLKQIAQHAFHVPIDDMQITEDLHLVLCHVLMKAFMAEIG